MRFSFFSKPSVTPTTMLLTSARIVPAMAVVPFVAGANFSVPSSFDSSTVGCRFICSSPLGPLTLTVWPSWLNWTAFGSSIGLLAILDISVSPSGDSAEHFAAVAFLARANIGNHAFRRTDDSHTETVLHARQVAG